MKSILVLGASAAILLGAAASPAQAGWHGGRGYYGGGWHGGYYRGYYGYRGWWGPRILPAGRHCCASADLFRAATGLLLPATLLLRAAALSITRNIA